MRPRPARTLIAAGRRRSRAAVALVAVALLALSACGRASGANTAGSADVLRMAATVSGPFTEQFNPLLTSSATASGYATLSMYEQLELENFNTGELEPWLATSYEWSKDGTSLTLKIRPGVKWSDGTDLTAADVAFTFELMQKNEALNAQSLPIAGATAPSADTAVITFSEPAFQSVWWRSAIVPKAIWSGVEDPVKFTNPHPVGSGPFALTTFTPQVITLKKNPSYWRPDAPTFSQLQYISYDSDSSAVSALQAGQVDWISPAISNPKSIADRDPAKIGYWVTARSTGIIFAVPNLTTYPLSDLPVRQAISVALDRDQISELGLGGLNQPIHSPTGLNPESEGEAKLISPRFKDLSYGPGDPAKAKQILTGAGYTLGSDGVFVTPKGQPLKIELKVPTSSAGFGDMVGAGQIMSKQLAVAGITLTVKTESPTAWRDDLNVGNYEMSLRSIGGTLSFFSRYDRALSQDALVPVGKKALANYQRYKNPEAGVLLTQYRNAEPGSKAEAAALDGLQEIMVDDVPLIPLYLNSGIGMWRTDRYTGWPGEENPYAASVGAEPGASLILATVTPAQATSASQ